MSTAAHPNTLVVGTRGSLLARTQTRQVIDALHKAHPDCQITEEIITTKGDREQSKPLPEIGGKGLFTEELESALAEKRIDIAVHSAKDLPTELPDGLGIIGFPARVDCRDAWVSADSIPFEQLPEGSAVGTTSLRRQAQLLMTRPDLKFVQLRGNVDTRIQKVHRGDCAGAVLAMAGLIRVELTEHVTHPFEPETMLPAPGQGALALEGRLDDVRVLSLISAVHDAGTALAVGCERAILAELAAGCSAPVGLLAEVRGDRLGCRAVVSTPRGDRCVRAEAELGTAEIDAVVRDMLDQLLSGGAAEIIAACQSDPQP